MHAWQDQACHQTSPVLCPYPANRFFFLPSRRCNRSTDTVPVVLCPAQVQLEVGSNECNAPVPTNRYPPGTEWTCSGSGRGGLAVGGMSAVIPKGITGQKPSHDRGDGNGAGSEQEVKMVGNQCPSIASCSGFSQDISESSQKIVPVGIVLEYSHSFNTHGNDMVKGSQGFGFTLERGTICYELFACICSIIAFTFSFFENLFTETTFFAI